MFLLYIYLKRESTRLEFKSNSRTSVYNSSLPMTNNYVDF